MSDPFRRVSSRRLPPFPGHYPVTLTSRSSVPNGMGISGSCLGLDSDRGRAIRPATAGIANDLQFLPPALAEEVIFLVASVCTSVCLFALCRLNHWTYGPKIGHTQ